jgi:hemerythrin superfamily protein
MTMPSRKQEKSGTDAITLLKQDHETVRRMFEDYEKSDEDRKFELAAEICQALTVHSAIEEEIFYPRVREAIDAEDLMLEAEIEHDTVKNLIDRVQEGEIDETQLSAIIKVMNEYVNHHVNEEQRRMFPRVKRSDIDLEALGQELLARKTELEAELQAAMGGAVDASDIEDVEDDSGDDGTTGQTRGGMAARRSNDDGL